MSTPTFDISDTPPASAKPRRGRPPGSTNKPKTSGATDAATLKQALATMESLYSVTSAGLLMVGLPATATAWAEAAEDLNKRNEEALKAAPRLAKAIASTGSVGGATTFIVTHALAFASIFRVAQGELAARRETVNEIVESDA